MINAEVGTSLRQFGVTADRAQAAEFRVVDDATFVREFCASEVSRDRPCTPERAQGVEGFNDERPTPHGRVFIRRSANNPATIIHESIHLYQHRSLDNARCIGRINEAITEYYTRRIVQRENLARRQTGYEEMTDGMERLIEILGSSAAIDALYFNGDWGPLRAAINSRTRNNFAAWRCEWVQATALVNNSDDYERLNSFVAHYDASLLRSYCATPANRVLCE